MKVILLEKIKKQGIVGNVIKVRNGFGRNYLLYKKRALRANEENIILYQRQKNWI